MKFSPSIAVGCIQLMDVLSRNSNLDISNVRHVQLISVQSSDIVKYLIGIKWVEVKNSKKLTLTNRGSFIMGIQSNYEKIQFLLLDYIKEIQPHWIYILRRGRIFTTQHSPEGVRQVIHECGLADGTGESVASFWNEVIKYTSKDKSSLAVETGRTGEILTLRYEKDRTKTSPIWTAMENSNAGYDIESLVSSTDSSILRIEVKATTMPIGEAAFYISENEWNATYLDGTHKFYLWWISRLHTMLAKLEVEDISANIPKNQGYGTWKKVGIPYQIYKSKFCDTSYLPD